MSGVRIPSVVDTLKKWQWSSTMKLSSPPFLADMGKRQQMVWYVPSWCSSLNDLLMVNGKWNWNRTFVLWFFLRDSEGVLRQTRWIWIDSGHRVFYTQLVHYYELRKTRTRRIIESTKLATLCFEHSFHQGPVIWHLARRYRLSLICDEEVLSIW